MFRHQRIVLKAYQPYNNAVFIFSKFYKETLIKNEMHAILEMLVEL